MPMYEHDFRGTAIDDLERSVRDAEKRKEFGLDNAAVIAETNSNLNFAARLNLIDGIQLQRFRQRLMKAQERGIEGAEHAHNEFLRRRRMEDYRVKIDRRRAEEAEKRKEEAASHTPVQAEPDKNH